MGAIGPQGPQGAPGIVPQVESAQALPLAGQWTAFGPGYAEPTFQKSLSGQVFLQGMARTLGSPAASHVGVLPPGYRPGLRLIFTVNSHNKTSRVDVLPDGRIFFIASDNYLGWLPLNGINFRAEQ